MNRSEFSQHAAIRSRQRGIPEDVIDTLWNFGRIVHNHAGAELLFFDKQAKQRLRKMLPHACYVQLERHLNTYAVIADNGIVITVGHRTRHINRN